MTKITLTIEDSDKAQDFLEELADKAFINIDSIVDENDIDKKLQVSEEAIKYGNVIGQSELEKEINSWREK